MKTLTWLISLLVVFVGAVIFTSTVFYNLALKSGSAEAVERCVSLCTQAKNSGVDLSNGPCLSNSVAPGWVCDVAHWPREEVDNDPENQCSAFREGKAKHFVEVDENCNVIRVM